MKLPFAHAPRRLGRCPRCMQKALLAALSAWGLAVAATLSGGAPSMDWGITLAVLATGLWIAHVIAFALNRMQTRAAAAQIHQSGIRAPSRRQFIVSFAQLVGMAATASIISAPARAASACGCKVGDIRCDPQTHVTYECEDIGGCTMWILKGQKC